MTLRDIFRLGLLGATLCLLSACWASETPLLDAGNASRVPFEGSYVDGEGAHLTIESNEDGSYSMSDDEEDESMTAHFLALGGGWYVAQYDGHDGEEGAEDEGQHFYIYQPIRFSGGMLHMYEGPCDEALDGIDGVERSNDTCGFTSLAALKEAAANVVARYESGALTGEPSVFRPLVDAPLTAGAAP